MEKDKVMVYNIIQTEINIIKDNSRTINIMDGARLNNIKVNGNQEKDMVMVF